MVYCFVVRIPCFPGFQNDTHRYEMKTAYDKLAYKYPISVIIPCYNAAEPLKNCLAALLENELSNAEVIIVDDASTDATPELIDSLKPSFGCGIQYIRLAEQGGPAAARNTGMNLSNHPYLFFLDADIVLPGLAIQWIRETLDLYSHRNHVIGVLGTYSEEVPASDFFTVFKNLYTCYLYRMTDTLSPFVHTPIFAVRKAVMEREGGFDSNMIRAEDFKLGAVLGSKGYRFIIDWRIKGTHLKTYTFLGILREDWHRIRELRDIRMTREQRKFSYRAHRWSRILSLALPGFTVLLAALGILLVSSLWFAGASLILFLLVNLRFYVYLHKRQSVMFAIGSVAFLFVEMLWAQIALGFSSLLPQRSKRAPKDSSAAVDS